MPIHNRIRVLAVIVLAHKTLSGPATCSFLTPFWGYALKQMPIRTKRWNDPRAGRWFPAAGHALPAARSQQSRRNMGSVDPETRPKQRASCRGLHDERIADCVANVPGPVHRGAAGKSGNHSGAWATGQSRRDDHAALLIRVRAGVAVSSVDPEGVDRAGGGVLIRLKTDHESPRIVTNEHE